MKLPLKALILCLMLLLGRIHLRAQQQFVGIKGGSGVVSVITEGPGYPGFDHGFSAGFLYNYQAKSRFTFGTELLYERRGYSNYGSIFKIFDLNESKYSLPTHFDYITLPVLIGYTFGNKFTVRTSVGVCPGTLIRATTNIRTDISFDFYPVQDNTFTSKTVDIKSSVNNYNFSVLADITFGYAIKKRIDLFLDTRFQEGLTNVMKGNNQQMWNDDMYLSLGMRYCLNKF